MLLRLVLVVLFILLTAGQVSASVIDDVLEKAKEVGYYRGNVDVLMMSNLGYSKGSEAYMNETRAILLFLGVSDCKMEQGSLRFEASCSMRPVGSEKLGSRVESALSSLESGDIGMPDQKVVPASSHPAR